MGAFLQTLTPCLVWVWSLISCGKEKSEGTIWAQLWLRRRGSPFHLALPPPSPLLRAGACVCLYMRWPQGVEASQTDRNTRSRRRGWTSLG